jgi:hypothetical protein
VDTVSDNSINNLRIKPIETHYKGYKMRSRLEARWAVAFDALNIKWEYEHEGFDLGYAGYYLPDFWLPEHDAFAEVKPGRLTDNELNKVVALCDVTHKPVLLLCGVPEWNGGYPFIVGRAADGGLDTAIEREDPWFYVGEIAANAARSARFEYGESG